MESNLNKSSLDKLFKKGQNELKTSIFKLKFSADHLSAVSYFTDAAKGYKKLKLFKESITAFEEALKCNNKLLDMWSQAQNYEEIADIYIFELNTFLKGWESLQNACMCYKLSGKFTSGIKIYIDFSNKLIDTKNDFKSASVILKQATDDCFDQTQDALIRISLEDCYIKLLDVYCYQSKYIDAVELVEKYIKAQKTMKDEPKHKISKNYLKLGMLRIIIDELYMAEHLIDEMFAVYDSSCSDDIDDLKKLINAFKTNNKKDFNYLMTYAFTLFQSNLLKALKAKFDTISTENTNNNNLNVNSNNSNHMVVNMQDNNLSSMNSTSSELLGETKANSELGGGSENVSNLEHQPSNNTNSEWL